MLQNYAIGSLLIQIEGVNNSMSKDKDSIKIAKLVKILSGDKKIDQIANVIDKISVKESEQLRPIVPVSEWVNDPYYVGKDGYEKLYPFWKDLI